MKKLFVLLAMVLCIINTSLFSQNIAQCDSLTIDCCYFNLNGNGSLTINVSNPSSVLFDYPSFHLVDMNGDTVATETVNYFGISTGPQPHLLVITSSFTLPFSGNLVLNTGFNSSTACVFPIYIPDTISSISSFHKSDVAVQYHFHNRMLQVKLSGNANEFIELLDACGRVIKATCSAGFPIVLFDLSSTASGIYMIKVSDRSGKVFLRKILI
jgi:hypothetical protein